MEALLDAMRFREELDLQERQRRRLMKAKTKRAWRCRGQEEGGRPITGTSSKIVKMVRSSPDRNPKRSMRNMVKEFGIGGSSMRTIVREKLNLYPYRLQEAHALADVIGKNRKTLCKQLLKRFAQSPFSTIVFTDEILFSVDQVANEHNGRVICGSITQANCKGRIVARTAHPQSVMVTAWLSRTHGGEFRGWRSSPALIQQRKTTSSTISEIPRVVVTVAAEGKEERPITPCLSLLYDFAEEQREQSSPSSRCSMSFDLEPTRPLLGLQSHSLSMES
ncbi:hypothetical protein ANCDUO_02428 [Ancylostoma duodenale]|uniref:Uncharacterized protein n=1 Tax=Ancylostoma duodenale TaxID=51022 RepID=A0A0C2DBQ4_9BILA|nr:hypothetical protein ANCDUO_02428 [Ancylostoma duodenale]